MYKFSLERFAMYPASLLGSYSGLPGDLIDVSQDEYELFQMYRNSKDGKQLKVGAYPFELEDAPPTPIEELRTEKLAELSAKCHDVICAGFITDVLGFDVHYRSNENDQLKFNLAANNVNGGYVWEGEALTNHTQAQGRKLLDAFVQHFNAVNLHYADLFAQCKGASTNEAIEAIAWGNSDIQMYPSA